MREDVLGELFAGFVSTGLGAGGGAGAGDSFAADSCFFSSLSVSFESPGT